MKKKYSEFPKGDTITADMVSGKKVIADNGEEIGDVEAIHINPMILIVIQP